MTLDCQNINAQFAYKQLLTDPQVKSMLVNVIREAIDEFLFKPIQSLEKPNVNLTTTKFIQGETFGLNEEEDLMSIILDQAGELDCLEMKISDRDVAIAVLEEKNAKLELLLIEATGSASMLDEDLLFDA